MQNKSAQTLLKTSADFVGQLAREIRYCRFFVYKNADDPTILPRSANAWGFGLSAANEQRYNH
jgi:hypothetical protein